jgi:hypothetical protein
LAALPVLRDRFIHSNAGKILSAGSLASGPNPQIKPIEVLPTAPPEIQKIANDRSVPTVVQADPATSPYATSRMQRQ